ncbi:MAG: 16S rRNA (guanine(966)-N(2))-methyltransferase RsmD [Candidatus Omnitrophica bacterium]|nr:16S rRNA (guanine(966)-N(2))-methyltransferase RsmD [Candidatus Omnitrophota bacterium]
MKVISGYLKGKRLIFPEGRGRKLRPTKDLVREAIFDTLRGWIESKRVLDLFAGTGALGIEAVSHGAQEVFFVESDRDAVNSIRKNIEYLNISDICTVKKGKAEKVIETLENEKFDLIIADPPYDYPGNKILHILQSIAGLKVAGDEGIIVFEHGDRDKLPEVEGLAVYKEKTYGKSMVSYLKAVKNEKDSDLPGQF